MTPLPKRKLSTRRQGNREKAIKVAPKITQMCEKCGKPKFAHHVCMFCGQFKNQQIITIKTLKKKTSD